MTADEEQGEPPDLLSIGELAERTGVARTALRYYDELGLVRPVMRAAGRRRYAHSAINDVSVICFLREVGFSLSEIRALMSVGTRRLRDRIVARKIAEITEQQHRLEVARTALEHGQRCPADEPAQCSRFRSIIESHRSGLSLEDSHDQAHPQPHSSPPA